MTNMISKHLLFKMLTNQINQQLINYIIYLLIEDISEDLKSSLG